jgi:predicted polyphosphate/ATP-dependent NAD kinase
MTRRVCIVVNPLAGIGGPLALKGSDGEAALTALKRGARLVAPERARRFVKTLAKLVGTEKTELEVLTAGGLMGSNYIRETRMTYEIVYEPSSWPTSREDTISTVRKCLENSAEAIVFVGGDGTARDVYQALQETGFKDIPLLGVPGGVKMYSSVFARTPEAAAYILVDWAKGVARAECYAEILDIDEEQYRKGLLLVKIYAVSRTFCHKMLIGVSKQPTQLTADEEENMRGIARYFIEEYYKPCTLYILGPGTTVKTIADQMGIDKTLLGVDVVHNKKLLAKDADEETLYNMVKRHREKGGEVRIVLTPIGGQGYILGRGNQQISPRVIREAGGRKAIIVVATRSKLSRLHSLYVDTGDPNLDKELEGYIRVIVDYREETVLRVLRGVETI